MDKETLDKHLIKGNQFGIQINEQVKDYIEWVSLEKKTFDQRIYELSSHINYIKKEQELNKKKPYVIIHMKVIRLCEKEDRHPGPDDYVYHKLKRFKTLDNSLRYFEKKYKATISDLKWMSQLETD